MVQVEFEPEIEAQVRREAVSVHPHRADAAHEREFDAPHPHLNLRALPG